MHIHRPKPLHGWRATFGEIGVICVGILLALAAEQVIETLHWREQVGVAEAGIKDELRDSLMNAYERLIVEPCLRAQITLLHDRLKAPGTRWTAAPVQVQGANIHYVLPTAYRTPSRIFATDFWKNAIASGVIGHMAADRVSFFSGQYYEIADFDQLQEKEATAASRLAVLSEDGDLSPDVRIALLGNLAEIDRINALMVRLAEDLLEEQANIHLHYSKAQIDGLRRDLVNYDRAHRGTCVADLPLDLG